MKLKPYNIPIMLSESTPKKAILFFISLASAILTYFIASSIFLPRLKSNSQVLSAQSLPPSPPPPPENLADLSTLSFLLLGYGGPGHQGGFLTDTIVIAHINFKTKKVAFITIPRDLFITFPDSNQRKINAAFAYGGNLPDESRENLNPDDASSGSSTIKSLITQITNLPINYFVAVDFVGLQRAIGEVLNTIEVNVKETLDDPWYPIEGKQLDPCGHTPEEIHQLTQKYSGYQLQKQFPCRYEHLHFDAGLVRMEGSDVLKFARSRHSSNDFGRSKRQIAILLGIKNKLFKLNAFDDAVAFFKSLLYTIHTDLNPSIIKYLAPALKSAQDFKVTTIHLDTTNVFKESKSSAGAFILIPKSGQDDWQQTHSFINSHL